MSLSIKKFTGALASISLSPSTARTKKKRLPQPKPSQSSSAKPLSATIADGCSKLATTVQRELNPAFDAGFFIQEKFSELSCKHRYILTIDALQNVKEACFEKINQLKDSTEQKKLFELVAKLQDEVITEHFTDVLQAAVTTLEDLEKAHHTLQKTAQVINGLQGQKPEQIMQTLESLDLSAAEQTFPHTIEREIALLQERVKYLELLKPEYKGSITNIKTQIERLQNVIVDPKLTENACSELKKFALGRPVPLFNPTIEQKIADLLQKLCQHQTLGDIDTCQAILQQLKTLEQIHINQASNQTTIKELEVLILQPMSNLNEQASKLMASFLQHKDQIQREFVVNNPELYLQLVDNTCPLLKELLEKLLQQKEKKSYGKQGQLHPSHPCALALSWNHLRKSPIAKPELEKIDQELKDLSPFALFTLDRSFSRAKIAQISRKLEDFEQKLGQHEKIMQQFNKQYKASFPMTTEDRRHLREVRTQVIQLQVSLKVKKQLIAFTSAFLDENIAYDPHAISEIMRHDLPYLKMWASDKIRPLILEKLATFHIPAHANLSDPELARFVKYARKLVLFLNQVDAEEYKLVPLKNFLIQYLDLIDHLPHLDSLSQASTEQKKAALQKIENLEKEMAKVNKDFPLPIHAQQSFATFTDEIRRYLPTYSRAASIVANAKLEKSHSAIWHLNEQMRKMSSFKPETHYSTIKGLSRHKAVFYAEKRSSDLGIDTLLDEIQEETNFAQMKLLETPAPVAIKAFAKKIKRESKWFVSDLLEMFSKSLDNVIKGCCTLERS